MSSRDKPKQTAGRDPAGKFQKGCSAGPGRPAGIGEHREALLRACTPADMEEVVRALVDQAKQGDAAAARLLMDRVYGRAREEQPTMRAELPDLTSAQEVAEAMRLVVAAVARGELPADHGRAWVDLLTAVLEAGEVEQVLRACDIGGADPWRRG
jgi:hypothetical protein